MLKHELLAEKGVLIVRPEEPLLAALEAHGGLKGPMICANAFPG